MTEVRLKLTPSLPRPASVRSRRRSFGRSWTGRSACWGSATALGTASPRGTPSSTRTASAPGTQSCHPRAAPARWAAEHVEHSLSGLSCDLQSNICTSSATTFALICCAHGTETSGILRTGRLSNPAAARRAPPLMTVPAWVHAPSRYQQHWIRYGLLSLATSYGALWVYRRDPAPASLLIKCGPCHESNVCSSRCIGIAVRLVCTSAVLRALTNPQLNSALEDRNSVEWGDD